MNDDRQLPTGSCSQAIQHLEPTQVGQIEIEKNSSQGFLLRQPQSLLTVGRLDDGETCVTQQPPEKVTRNLVVINEQNFLPRFRLDEVIEAIEQPGAVQRLGTVGVRSQGHCLVLVLNH